MKISPLLHASSQDTARPIAQLIDNRQKIDFKSVLQSLEQKSLTGFDQQLDQINKIKSALEGSKTLEPAKILQFQMQINELNIKVELISKAAESAASLVRKLQNNQ